MRYFTLIGLTICLMLMAVSSVQAQAVKNLFFHTIAPEPIIRLDFSTDPPTPINTGIVGPEGVAESITHYENCEGNVVFWVNSNGVYNQNNEIMPGSAGILVNKSAADIGIVPIPSESKRFYLIYNTEKCSKLYYSIVDLNLNGGLGEVTNLNTSITNFGENYAEGIEIVSRTGTNDYWLLAYQCDVGMKGFLIDASGIGAPTNLYAFSSPAGYDGRGELDYYKGKMAIAWFFKFAFHRRL